MSYQNRNQNQQNRGPANYLRSSSCTKTLHYNNETDPQTGKSRREKVALDFDLTEEFSITLTAPKAQDMIDRITAAMNDQQGTGGVRISMYARRSQNQQTGEEFDGMGILVTAQKPPQNGGGGRFQGQGNFRGGGGRRQYPPRGQAQSNGQAPATRAPAARKPAQAPAAPAPEQEEGTETGAPF